MSDKQIIRISAHYLEDFEACPLYFHRRNNLLRGNASSPSNMARGTAMHLILKYYYKGVQAEVPFDANVAAALQAFQVEAININGFLLEDTEDILRTFNEYVEHYRNRDDFTILSVEEKLSRVLYEDDDICILYEGTQDLNVRRSDGDVLCYDHKTEKAKWTISQLNNQFLGYCFLTHNNRMIRNAIGFQKSKPPAEKFYRTMYSFSNSALNWWQRVTIKKVQEILRHYRDNDWSESANLLSCDSMHRSGCIFKSVCIEDESEWERILETDFVHVELYT